MTPPAVVDPLAGRIPVTVPDALRAFVDAEVLQTAEVHVARRLTELRGCADPAVLLGAALAARAPRLGHVCVDIAAIASQAGTVDGTDPAWPEAAAWRAALATSPLVALGDDPVRDRPLRLVGDLLYLDRYWREERQVAADLLARAGHPAPDVDHDALRDGLAQLFDAEAREQAVAAATGVLRRLTVIAGRPGTGKTTTIARLLALLDAQPGGLRPRLVALAAPTGKAAARMEEAVHVGAEALPPGVPPETTARLRQLRGVTMHRLLGRRMGSDTRFKHDRANRLPHEVVVVDEASMASLSLMARLLEALRDDARLILVGDPDQLASVEAGAVLGDIIGPARDRVIRRPAATAALADVLGAEASADAAPQDSPIGDGVVVLRQVHRFGGSIATLADSIRRGEPDEVLRVLGSGAKDVHWIECDPATATDDDIASIRTAAVDAGAELIRRGRTGDAEEALAALNAFRLLAPHRRGPYGVDAWQDRIEAWLRDRGAVSGRWYPGRPLLVTENDYALRLFNGDTGVIVRRESGPVAAFERAAGVIEISPSRLGSVVPVHAMTIHKSQGSQFETVGVIVAPADSPISTRELLYTAVTRAQTRVVLVGEAEAIAAAVERPVARASGLRGLLWP